MLFWFQKRFCVYIFGWKILFFFFSKQKYKILRHILKNFTLIYSIWGICEPIRCVWVGLYGHSKLFIPFEICTLVTLRCWKSTTNKITIFAFSNVLQSTLKLSKTITFHFTVYERNKNAQLVSSFNLNKFAEANTKKKKTKNMIFEKNRYKHGQGAKNNSLVPTLDMVLQMLQALFNLVSFFVSYDILKYNVQQKC